MTAARGDRGRGGAARPRRARVAQSPEPGAPEPRTNLSDIEDEVICLVCGTTLELTDNAPQAEQLRDQIRGLIDQGLTKDEIKDELVAEYGESVLATPDTEGFDLTAWVLPGLAIVLAGAAIAVGLARNRGRRDPDGAEPALSDERPRAAGRRHGVLRPLRAPTSTPAR